MTQQISVRLTEMILFTLHHMPLVNFSCESIFKPGPVMGKSFTRRGQ